MKYDRVKLSKPIPVKLPVDLLKRIDAISKQIGEPRSTVMRFAMSIGLAALEKAVKETPAPNLSALIYPSAAQSATALNEPKAKTTL